MHRLKVHRPFRVRRACRCQQMHRLKVHFRVRRACRCPRRLKVHRPRRVRRACKCLQINAQAQGAQALSGQACLQVPPYAQAQGAQALPGACKGTGSRCTGPSGSGVLAGVNALKVHRPLHVPACTGSRCTEIHLSGVPGSADAAGPQSLLQHRPSWVLCQASQVQQMPQVLIRSGPYCSTDCGSCARRPRFSRCHRSSGPYCSMDHRGSIARRPRFNRVQHKPRGSCAGRSRISRCHRSSGPYVVQATGHLCQAAQAPGVYCGGWDSPLKFPSWLFPQQPKT